MGGFALDLDVSDLDERKKPGLLVLTPRGVKLLAECGYLPNISEEEILDKSKTDCLGRLISLLQAIWMLAQTLGRVAANLPVTLLEVNTLAHVLCALIIFFLWWKKPKQINEPTLLRGRWVREIGAYMFMSSQVSGWKSQNPGILKKTWVKAEFSALAFELTSEPEARNQLSADSTQFAQSLGKTATLTEPAGDAAHVTGSFKFRSFSAKPTEGDEKKDVPINSDYIQEIFSGKTPDRWDLAARAIHRYPAIKTRLIPLQKTGCSTTAIWQEPMTKELVVRCAGNWPDHSLLRDMSGFVMGVVLWFASMAYGGLHSAAWHHYFPSKLEAWLWRASSVCIASAGLIWSVINLLAQISTSFKAYWKDVIELRAHWISLVGLGSLATVCGTAYLMARAFLVVEAFISLRSLPASAYETPDWTQLFPHL